MVRPYDLRKYTLAKMLQEFDSGDDIAESFQIFAGARQLIRKDWGSRRLEFRL